MSALSTGWIDGREMDSLPAHPDSRPGPKPRESRSAATQASRQWVWSADEGRFHASMRVVSGVAVLTFEGYVGREAVQACRSALETALRLRPAKVVLDMQQARIDSDSRPLITMMGRMSGRRGISLWLAGLAVPARMALRSGEEAPYRVFATVNAALDEAAAPARQRRY